MSNYPKNNNDMVYPVHAPSPTGLLKRAEPLLTPALLKSRFLKGITERLPAGVSFSDDELKDRINIAVNELEVDLGCNVFAERIVEKAPFDFNLYKSYIHTRTQQVPIMSIEDFSIVSSDGAKIFPIPATWLSTAQMATGLLHVIPLLSAYGSSAIQSANTSASAYLSNLFMGWVPSFFQITYQAGLANNPGQVPVLVNKLIGIYTSIELLSGLAALNQYSSQSLSQDSISQSSAGPSTQLYVQRIEDLTLQKQQILGQLKRVFSRRMFISAM